MLIKPNKAETALHDCHCPGYMAVRMLKLLARPWVAVRVCHLLLSLLSRHVILGFMPLIYTHKVVFA